MSDISLRGWRQRRSHLIVPTLVVLVSRHKVVGEEEVQIIFIEKIN